jgi:cytochrome bd-type quinol oxidase subunit 2
MANEPETEWEHKDKMWTYLIAIAVLVAVVVVVNLVWKHPEGARDRMHEFLGLPSYVLASVLFVVGVLIFWAGLKIEPDWPEAIGGFMIAGAVAWFERIAGWERFDFGGLIVVPYLIPVVVFLLLLMYAARYSR